MLYSYLIWLINNPKLEIKDEYKLFKGNGIKGRWLH
ncbi:MAG: hypothetical protein JWO06_1182 [Bacteroidota bacterium]|nr:hypothetical protein [Bacteroidota bacterium]